MTWYMLIADNAMTMIPFLVAFLVIICAGQRLPCLLVPEEHCLIAVTLIHKQCI